jgi:putative nucleotidyltransferase with HDIG domain
MTSRDLVQTLTRSLQEHDSVLTREGQSENLTSAKMLTRLAGYTVVLAWVTLGAIIIILSQDEGETVNIVKYFLSPEDSGMRFRALMLLAPLILTAIAFLINERAKLYQKALYAEGELRLLLNSLVVAFANALDAKSSWTMGHSARVASYALAIAKEMGFSDYEMEVLKIASLLHDIGKLGTYDVILDKTDDLTAEEWELIKMHPVKGADILKPIKHLEQVIPIIKYHHERLDGTGYPEGLKGGDIPRLARILCVADAFDAMTANRPYHRVLNNNEALVHLRKNAGTQFDPAVVDAFSKVHDANVKL